MTLRPIFAPVLGLLLTTGLGAANAACYTVLDAKEQVVFRSQEPPVDLALPLHATVPALLPGAKMIFWPSDAGCESEIHRLPRAGAPAAAPGAADPVTERPSAR